MENVLEKIINQKKEDLKTIKVKNSFAAIDSKINNDCFIEKFLKIKQITNRKNGKYVNLFVNVNHRRSQLFEPRLFR